MKGIVYAVMVLAAAGVILYFITNARKMEADKFVPSGNFEADDKRLYDLMRADLQAYEMEHNNDTIAWFDDMVAQAYPTSFIAGKNSRALAYLQTLKKTNGVHPKLGYFNQLVYNLKNRYQ